MQSTRAADACRKDFTLTSPDATRDLQPSAEGLARTSLAKGMRMSESNLKDRAAIHDLFTRYCCAVDDGGVARHEVIGTGASSALYVPPRQ